MAFFTPAVWVSLAVMFLFAAIISRIVPNVVRYVESVEIRAPIGTVFDAIRFQEKAAQWSAWPEATGTTCRIEGPSGDVGARTVYLRNDNPTGYQCVAALRANEYVALDVADPTPFGQQLRLTFRLETHKKSDETVVVNLFFENRIPRPFHLVIKFAGLPEWAQDVHRKDLQRLKAFAEAAARQ